MRLNPAAQAKAPLIAGFKSGKIILGIWGRKVIARRAREGQEFIRHHCTDGVHAVVVSVGVASAIAKKSSDWIHATALELRAKNVFSHRSGGVVEGLLVFLRVLGIESSNGRALCVTGMQDETVAQFQSFARFEEDGAVRECLVNLP